METATLVNQQPSVKEGLPPPPPCSWVAVHFRHPTHTRQRDVAGNGEDRETQAACTDQGEHSFVSPAGSVGSFPKTEHSPGVERLVI